MFEYFLDARNNCFKQIAHGSSEMPDLVVAQVRLENGYISEGQGIYFVNLFTLILIIKIALVKAPLHCP